MSTAIGGVGASLPCFTHAQVTFVGSYASNPTAFNQNANWSGGHYPTGSNNALFDDAADGSLNGAVITASLNNSVLSLELGDNNGDTLASSFTISGNTITLAKNLGGTLPTGLLRNASGVQTINSNLALGKTQLWNIAGTGTLVVNGVVSDGGSAFALTKSSGGTLELAGTNTFTGQFTVQGGTVIADTASSLGADTTDPVLLDAGTSTSNATLLLSNNVTLSSALVAQANQNAKVVTIGVTAATNNAATFTGTVTLNQGIRLDAPLSTQLTVQGAIQDGATAGTVTNVDGGTTILSGQNTYTGTTTALAGLLLINGTNSGQGTYSVAAGATLGGNGTISTGTGAAGLQVASGGTLSPGTPATIGTLSVTGDATLNGTLAIRLSDAATDQLHLTGALAINGGTLSLSVNSTLTAPVYVLATYGSFSGSFANLQNAPPGYTLAYDYNNADEIAFVSSSSAPEPTTASGLILASAVLLRRRAKR